uniref:Uncharacterized protein n=1 Tax=Anguilla anguilla TaxID=7936 RepID=A0A0E9QBP3_ANGAN
MKTRDLRLMNPTHTLHCRKGKSEQSLAEWILLRRAQVYFLHTTFTEEHWSKSTHLRNFRDTSCPWTTPSVLKGL